MSRPALQWKPVFTHLTFYVLLALLAGIWLGIFYPATAVKMEVLGKSFIEVIKLFIYPIIFFTLVSGIGGMGNLRKAGRIGIKALVYFEIVTTFSLLIGIVVALVLQPGKVDRALLPAAPSSASVGPQTVQDINWIEFLRSNHTLQVLLVAVVAGILLAKSPRREQVLPMLNKVSGWVFAALKYVMYLAPLGAFGGIAYTTGKFGVHTLLPLIKLIGSVYAAMGIFIVFVLGAILRYYRLSIFRYLYFIREELLIVLGTSSSETALPSLMLKLELAGCSKPTVGLVVPTGYSFNLDGTSIYLSMAVIFLAQLYQVPLGTGELISLLMILMITSKGAAGVTGSGYVVLASTLSALHRIPLEGLAILLGIDKFMSESRALTNIIGNGVAALAIAKSEGEKNISLSGSKKIREGSPDR